MSNQTTDHLQAVHRIVRYVSGTKDRGLLYQEDIVGHIVGYMDANLAGNIGDRRSTSAYACSLGNVVIA